MTSPSVEEIEYQGYWWLPEAPSQQVSGTLKLVPGGQILLTCFGDFPNYPTSFGALEQEARKNNPGAKSISILSLAPSSPPLINGMALLAGHWKEVTLYGTDCVGGTASDWDTPAFSLSRFSIKAAFIGTCFESLESAKFDAVEANYFRIRNWLGYDFLKRKWEERVKGKSISGTFTFTELPTVTISTIETTLRFATRVKPKQERQFRFELTYDVPIELRANAPQSFDWYLKEFSKLQILLALLCGHATNSIYYVGICGDTRLDIYFNSTREWVVDRYDDTHTLTTLTALESQFPQLVNTWFENFERFGKAIYLYNANVMEEKMYLNLRFLSLAQAAEAAHRELYGATDLDEADVLHYRELEQRLLSELADSASRAFYESVKSKLKFLPHTSLRSRLRKLFEAVEPAVSQYIPDERAFIEHIVNTRNYFTHHTRELETAAAQGAALFVLNLQIEVLLSATFLREIGLSVDDISRFFKDFPKYQRIHEIKRLNQL